jgi:DNA-binding XRE family transcriptional regulator
MLQNYSKSPVTIVILWIDHIMKIKNNVKKIREAKLLSKSELARKASVSVLTVGRIERGEECRMETMRKIILALGYTLEEKNKVFQNQE